MKVEAVERPGKRGINQVKTFFILLLVAILAIAALSLAAGSLEIVAEIIRLTPQVFIPLGMALVMYLLGSSIFAIIKWVTGKRKSAVSVSSFWVKVVVVFVLTACVEFFLAYGALYISDNEEKIIASLYRQLLYTGILFICTCVVIRSGRKKP